MNEWQSEFRYLLNRKILSRDELAELYGQIKSVIDREIYTLAIGLEKELERVNRQRIIEQGALPDGLGDTLTNIPNPVDILKVK